MKQLLLETVGYISPSTTLLENLKKDVGTKVVLTGVVQRANAKNGNGRIYPKAILEREIQKLIDLIKEQGYLLCHLDHSDDLEIKLELSCAKITKLWWVGDDVHAVIELLHESNPKSQIARSFLKSDIKLGISSRGEGSLREVGETSIVQNDLNLATWDIVSIPSTHGAFLNIMNESLTESFEIISNPIELDSNSKIKNIFNSLLNKS